MYTVITQKVALWCLLAFGVVSCAAARAQTDVAASLYGAFGSASSYANGEVHQSPADAAGGLFELRHVVNPLVGYEAAYSFNRANQVYTYTGGVPGSPTGPFVDSVSAYAHEITGDWVFSARVAKFRPFALVGAGILLTDPTSSLTGTQTQGSSTAVYVYGLGLEWRLLPQVGLRFEYRGNVHKAPNITTGIPNDAFIHTAEPALGVYFRF